MFMHFGNSQKCSVFIDLLRVVRRRRERERRKGRGLGPTTQLRRRGWGRGKRRGEREEGRRVGKTKHVQRRRPTILLFIETARFIHKKIGKIIILLQLGLNNIMIV